MHVPLTMILHLSRQNFNPGVDFSPWHHLARCKALLQLSLVFFEAHELLLKVNKLLVELFLLLYFLSLFSLLLLAALLIDNSRVVLDCL